MTKQKAEARAKELGVTIEDECDNNPANWLQTIEIIAPHGKVFTSTGTHICVAAKGNAGLIPKAELWAALIEDMQHGLSDCEEHQRGECDWCGDEDEDECTCGGHGLEGNGYADDCNYNLFLSVQDADRGV